MIKVSNPESDGGRPVGGGQQELDEYLDLLPDQRSVAYATLLSQTGIAVEVIKDGSGIGWFTGDGTELIAVEESTDEPDHVPHEQFERWLVEHDSVVTDRNEIPAFRELVE